MEALKKVEAAIADKGESGLLPLEAVSIAKDTSVAKFDATVEAHLRLGIDVRDDIAACAPASFDLVFVFFVLEHVGDPLVFLAAIRRVCRPGARVIFVVPNVDDVLLSVYKLPKFRDFYFTPAHQFYYSPQTMTRLFERAGFTRFDIFQKQRYDLSNHMQWMMDGRAGGMGRFDGIFSPALTAEYRRTLEAHQVADALFAVVHVE